MQVLNMGDNLPFHSSANLKMFQIKSGRFQLGKNLRVIG
jgi:hypothetical protein